MRKPINYWTKDRCREEALKYRSKKEFKINSGTAYNVVIKNSWMNELSQHMTGRTLNWIVEMCLAEALKYKNKIDFINKSSKAYHASIRLNCLNEVTKHMIRPIPYNKKWIKETCNLNLIIIYLK